MSPSPAVERRLRLAERAAVAYIANPHVAAVLVAGSVARALADNYSDIELDVYWERSPTEDERIRAVEGVDWERVYAEVDEDEWADGYMIDGVKVDTSGFVISTIDGHLDAVLDHSDTEPERQVRITALLDGRALHGGSVIDAWRSRCLEYPTGLAMAMVEAGLDLRPRERLERLAARDDVLLLHRDLVDNVQGILDALFGLNRVYVPASLPQMARLGRNPPDRLSHRSRRTHPAASCSPSTRGCRSTLRPDCRDLRPRREAAAWGRRHVREGRLRKPPNQLTARQAVRCWSTWPWVSYGSWSNASMFHWWAAAQLATHGRVDSPRS